MLPMSENFSQGPVIYCLIELHGLMIRNGCSLERNAS